jgi:O6-methylguanine-DNA--protein-cysteine methyltransferase
MPLKKGKSQKVMQENIREFHHGKTYARTARKYGKATADRQAVAAAYSQRRRSGKRR